MEWHARSPDLNITENGWGLLAKAVYAEKSNFGSVEELKNVFNMNGCN